MSNVIHLWGIFLGTIIGLLPIINPLAQNCSWPVAQWRQRPQERL